jgi:hypothetical protein
MKVPLRLDARTSSLEFDNNEAFPFQNPSHDVTIVCTPREQGSRTVPTFRSSIRTTSRGSRITIFL